MVHEDLELESLRCFMMYRKKKNFFDEYEKLGRGLVLCRKGKVLIIHEKYEDESIVDIITFREDEKSKKFMMFIKKMYNVFGGVIIKEIFERMFDFPKDVIYDEEHEYHFYYE
ncbi:MAG: hypothetical protein QW607_08445 [Desulfurococcaceae archaeon]